MLVELVRDRLWKFVAVLGAGIASYNIFNFSYTDNCPVGPLDFGFSLGNCEFEYLAYYYPENTLILISIGAMLLVLGLLNK